MPRPKGTPNKLTAGAKHAIFEVFDKIGGVENFAKWAIDNQDKYYLLWGKTIPQNLHHSGPEGKPIEILTLSDKDLLTQWNKQQKDGK